MTGTLAAAALAGWALDVPALQRPIPSTSALSPLTASTVMLLAIATWALAGPPRLRRAGHVAAGAGLMVALAGCAERVSPFDWGRLSEPGIRLAWGSAVGLAAIGVGLTGTRRLGRAWQATRYAPALGATIGGGSLVGFAMDVEFFYGPDRALQMAPHAALCVLLLSAAAWAVRPGRFVTMLSAPTMGGRLTRTVLPAMVAALALTGALAAAGTREDLFSANAAVWVMTMVALLSLIVLMTWLAGRLHSDELRLAELVLRDPLTGALNRRGFDAELARAADHARRYGRSGALAMIDLDHFKEINDSYGHATGDEVLARVVAALRDRLRSTDLLARIGGDEFVVFLPEADEPVADRVAGELARTVAAVAEQLAAEGFPSRLGASVGTALMDGSRTLADVLSEADVRMYKEKRRRRRRG